MKRPKAPQPTAEENVLRQRQVDELTRLDDEENTRVKRLARGRLGAGSLLSRRSGTSRTARGSMVSSNGGGGSSDPGGPGGTYGFY